MNGSPVSVAAKSTRRDLVEAGKLDKRCRRWHQGLKLQRTDRHG
jgi:hypothetical protein